MTTMRNHRVPVWQALGIVIAIAVLHPGLSSGESVGFMGPNPDDCIVLPCIAPDALLQHPTLSADTKGLIREYRAFEDFKAFAISYDPYTGLVAAGMGHRGPNVATAVNTAIQICEQYRQAQHGRGGICEPLYIGERRVLLAHELKVLASRVDKHNKMMMWQVNSAVAKMYILGGMNRKKCNFYPLDSSVERYLSETEKLIVWDNLEALSLEDQQIFRDAIFRDKGDILTEMSQYTRRLLEKKYQELGFSMNAIHPRAHPLIVANEILKAWGEVHGYCARGQTKLNMLRTAQDGGIPVEVIESPIHTQKRVLAAPLDIQHERLRWVLDQLDVLDELWGRLSVAWFNGDAQEMYDLYHHEDSKFSAKHQHYYQQQKKDVIHSYVQKIVSVMKSESVSFLVLPTPYLGGSEGLLKQLREAGFDIQQLSKSDPPVPRGVPIGVDNASSI